MARIEVSGIGIEYELLGEPGAPAIALIPGGRFSKDTPGIRELGQNLVAGGRRVLLWDRPNCGASDISFEGKNESELQGRVLTQLIRALELGPTAIGGGSAGSRAAFYAALHDPEAVSHLLVWWLSGGTISLLMLGAAYCGEPAIAASMGGMEAVAALAAWAEPLKNPRNRDFLLAQDPAKFIKTMESWAAAFVASTESPIPAISPQDFLKLKMPVLIFNNSDKDLYHPGWVSEWMRKLIPHAQFAEAPWPDDAFIRCMTEAARTGASVFVDWPKLAPKLLDFTAT